MQPTKKEPAMTELPNRPQAIGARFGSDVARWQAVLHRDPRADGIFCYAVSTTKVYCRPTCRARRPHRRNVTFFADWRDAEAHGFRPCKLCLPREAALAKADVSVRPAAILFADLIGFTRLASTLRPETALDFLTELHVRLGAVVTAHGGRVHKSLGDGLMAVFGDEASRPEDAQRAIVCGLGILAALSAWNQERERRGDAQLEVGVGVHFGLVAIGRIGSPGDGERAIIGDTVNVAQRLERATRRLDASLVVSDEAMRAVDAGRAAGLRSLLRRAGAVRLNGCRPRFIWIARATKGASAADQVPMLAGAAVGEGQLSAVAVHSLQPARVGHTAGSRKRVGNAVFDVAPKARCASHAHA
jgi:class 3 adenylate cyclase